MAGLGEPSMSVLERLLANAALRDEAGRLRSPQPPEPRAQPPAGGLLGWSQKDLQREFGIATDPPTRSLSPPSWSQDPSQDYDLGASSPGGDPGLAERDWSSPCRLPGVGDGSARERASRCSASQEESGIGPGRGDGHGVAEPRALATPDRVVGTLPAPQSLEPGTQAWEFTKRGSGAVDDEFGKRELMMGTYSSQDWEFEKREPLDGDTGRPSPEAGRDDPLARYSGQDADEQDWEFGQREPSLDPYYGGRGTAPPDPDFGTSAWMRDYGGDGSSAGVPGSQERGFGPRALSAGFSPEDAQQQDEEFEKKGPSGDAGQAGEAGGLFGPSSSPVRPGTPAQGEQGSSGSLDGAGWQGQAGLRAQSPGQAERGDGEVGPRGWASDFCQGVASQPEPAFGSGQRAWSGEFGQESTSATTAERNHQFGIIGNDRASGVGLGPSDKVGGSPFASPEKPSAVSVDWTDQLGLRNLEVPSCVVSGGLLQAREDAVGQTGWSGTPGSGELGLAASPLGTAGGPEEEPRGVGVGEKDWTGVSGRSPELVRESGVGQTGWSAAEAGEFLKSRERSMGQADWTPGLGLSDVAPGPREGGAGQVDWGDHLGLRNLEVPCDPEPEGSQGPRECGVGQMGWRQDLGTPSEAREHGVGEVSQLPDPALRSNGHLSPGLEARELGVGEMSGAETPRQEGPLPAPEELQPEDTGTESEDASSFAASPGGYSARSPPPGSQGLLEEMLAASREAVASRLQRLSEEEAAAGTVPTPTECPEPDSRTPLPSWRPQPDGEASRTEEVDGTWGPPGSGSGQQAPARPPRRPPQVSSPGTLSQDFSFMEDTEILDSAMYRSRANLGRKRGHRAPAIRPGGTLGLSEAADSDARLFQDSTEPRASRLPSSDEEVAEEPQNHRHRTFRAPKGLKVNLFPGLSPAALKAKLRPRNRSAEEGEPVESKPHPKESAVQRSKSCKVPGLGKPLALPPKPEKSSGSEGSSPNWLQALKLKKKKV